VVDCGTACPAETVADLNIINAAEGEARAICTTAGSSSGKNSEWTLHCDTNGNGIVDDGEAVQENSVMSKKCKIAARLDCGGEPEPDTDCDLLDIVQAANTNVVITCIEDKGKQEEMSCADQDGNLLSTFTGSKKTLVKWVTGGACGSGDDDEEDTDCDLLATVQAANTNVVVTCVADNGKKEEMSCADQDGNTLSTFEGNKKSLIKWVTGGACGSGDDDEEDTDCDLLAIVQAANTNVVVTCIVDNGKKEEMSCADQDGNTLSTFEGSKKALVKWVTGGACGSGDDDDGEVSCACETETSGFAGITCIGKDQYECQNQSGQTITFKVNAKKCKKVAKKTKCQQGAGNKNKNDNKNNSNKNNNNKNNNNKNNNSNKNNNKKKGK